MRNVLYISVLLVFGIFSGCSLKDRTITSLPKTFLADVDLTAKKDNLPFDHSWVKPGKHKAAYRTVYFQPVRTDLLPRNQWERSGSVSVTSYEDYMAKAHQIAE